LENPSRREAIRYAVAATLTFGTRTSTGAEALGQKHEKEAAVTEPDDKTLKDIVKLAKSVSEKAYCPYSQFRVGAVVLTEDGKTFEGCNVENASYGLTICAERNAVFQAVARGKQKVVAIVIYTPTPTPSAPCGACRQVINEFGPDAMVMSVCDGPDVLKTTLSKLLPEAFGPGNLAK
jgi:cytidine deaminase